MDRVCFTKLGEKMVDLQPLLVDSLSNCAYNIGWVWAVEARTVKHLRDNDRDPLKVPVIVCDGSECRDDPVQMKFVHKHHVFKPCGFREVD